MLHNGVGQFLGSCVTASLALGNKLTVENSAVAIQESDYAVSLLEALNHCCYESLNMLTFS